MDSFSILFRSDREHPVQIGHGTWHGLVDPDLLSVFSFCGVPLNRMYPVITCYVMNPDHHMGHVKCYCYHFYWFAACCYGRMCAAVCEFNYPEPCDAMPVIKSWFSLCYQLWLFCL
jgi:hypothetical protein